MVADLAFSSPGVAARGLIRPDYDSAGIAALGETLEGAGTFRFTPLPSGFFPAAHLSRRGLYTGYDRVWVRDNMQVANALFAIGETAVAARTVRATLDFYSRHRWRFEAIIAGQLDPAVPMNRPHVRFDGATLNEVSEDWSHAQNDALGYCLWLASRLHLAGALPLEPVDAALLALFPLYFRAIRYWQDADSGHWEEKRKVEASSIGAVVAGLLAFRRIFAGQCSIAAAGETVDVALLDSLIAEGSGAMARILPNECIIGDSARAADAALLFLIYPLEVTDAAVTAEIIARVETELKGEVGIRRYIGDSFWCADYDSLLPENRRTINVSEDMTARDALVRPGEEAQWCLFDPLLSTIFGRRFLAGGNPIHRAQQVHYFNRSLGQLTTPTEGGGELLCPELYYLRQGRFVPNDVTPLLWTQANLRVALETMAAACLQTLGTN